MEARAGVAYCVNVMPQLTWLLLACKVQPRRHPRTDPLCVAGSQQGDHARCRRPGRGAAGVPARRGCGCAPRSLARVEAACLCDVWPVRCAIKRTARRCQGGVPRAFTLCIGVTAASIQKLQPRLFDTRARPACVWTGQAS